MALAVLFAIAVSSAGFGVLRALGLSKGPLGLGLAPSAGLALLAVVSTWCGLLGLPPPLPGLVFGTLCLLGLGLVLLDRAPIVDAVVSLAREQPWTLLLLGLGAALPVLIMGVVFADIQAPLSPHDGAFHVETTHAFRLGL